MEVQDEAAKVIGWRLDQLIGLGFDVQRAEELARRTHEVDWHEVERWICQLGASVDEVWAVVS